MQKVILFGATGMVGQGVLKECIADSEIKVIKVIGRSSVVSQTQWANVKVQEIIQTDLLKYKNIEHQLSGFDACFFCLGTSSAGKSEAEYTRVTYGITMAAAQTLARLNPEMTFIYVSGQGADSSEKGRVMWARVRGKLENDLLKLPFKSVYIFRPGVIQPLDGIQSKTTAYRVMYNLLKPLLPMVRRAFPESITTTQKIGQVMIFVSRKGFPKKILSNKDFLNI